MKRKKKARAEIKKRKKLGKRKECEISVNKSDLKNKIGKRQVREEKEKTLKQEEVKERKQKVSKEEKENRKH